MDYTAITAVPLLFQSGTIECSSIAITDDIILEGTETFSVLLTSTEPDVVITVTSAPVSIQDNDSKTKHSIKYNISPPDHSR